MHVAALASLCLHAALLSLPLGGPHRERGFAVSAAGSAIRAFLRPHVAEPVPVAELAEAVAAPAPRPPASPEPVAHKDVKPEPVAPRGGRESPSAVAIPATFIDPSQLSEKPRPLAEPPLDLLHPILASPGIVRLILYIDESGNVTSTEIDSATLPLPAAERAAEIFAALRFSPGRIDGAAVKTRVRITVGAEERPTER